MNRCAWLPMMLLLAAPPVLAAEAHVHGQARLAVAVDGATLTLLLESPTDSLAGFEHAPTTAAEHAAVDRMQATLEQADRLFLPTPAADCTLTRVALESLLLGDEAHEGHEEGEDHADHDGHEDHDEHAGHADLDGSFTFECAHPERLRDLDVRLFEAFPGLRVVDAELAVPGGQQAARLTPENTRIAW